jgi:hypothetical protein
MVSFETPRGILIEEKIFACIEFLVKIPVSILFGVASGFIIWIIVNDIWLGGILAFIVGLFFLRFAWNGFLGRLRFCIQLHPDHVQIGRGLACCRFPYELVEMITIQRKEIKKANYLEIECMNHEVQVYLPVDSLAECVYLLRNSCNNSIYVDNYGQEHLPTNATRPDFILNNLRNYYLGKIMVWSIASIYTLLLDFHYCVMMYSWMQGKFIAMDLPYLVIFILSSGFGSVFSFFKLISYINKSLYLSRENKSQFDSEYINNTTTN